MNRHFMAFYVSMLAFSLLAVLVEPGDDKRKAYPLPTRRGSHSLVFEAEYPWRASFLRDIAIQDGSILMRRFRISDGDELTACGSWTLPRFVMVGSRRCLVKSYNNGILIVFQDGMTTNIFARSNVSMAKNEKEDRRNVFAELSFCNLSLSDLERNISVEQSKEGWICLQVPCLSERNGRIEKMTQCQILFKNITIKVEALSEAKEIALALLNGGLRGGG